MLTRKLQRIRELLIKAAKRTPAQRVEFCELADWAEEAIERIDRITFLEISMRSANEAVRALIDDDKVKRQQISDLTNANTVLAGENADLKSQLNAAQTNAVDPSLVTEIDTLIPPPPETTTTTDDAATAAAQ